MGGLMGRRDSSAFSLSRNCVTDKRSIKVWGCWTASYFPDAYRIHGHLVSLQTILIPGESQPVINAPTDLPPANKLPALHGILASCRALGAQGRCMGHGLAMTVNAACPEPGSSWQMFISSGATVDP